MMKKTCLTVLFLLTALRPVEARSTWEKDPQAWSEKDCNSILQRSPWYIETYAPSQFGSDSHYILRTHCLSPVILLAEARLEQLRKGDSLEALKRNFESKMAQRGLDKADLLVFRIVPLRGYGWRGQKLHPLYGGDSFLTGLPENITLIKPGDQHLSPFVVKPLGQGMAEGFEVYFENKGFVTPNTQRIDLVLKTGAGDFKIKFEPKLWRPVEFKTGF
jgi:hypothetical protein